MHKKLAQTLATFNKKNKHKNQNKITYMLVHVCCDIYIIALLIHIHISEQDIQEKDFTREFKILYHRQKADRHLTCNMAALNVKLSTKYKISSIR